MAPGFGSSLRSLRTVATCLATLSLAGCTADGNGGERRGGAGTATAGATGLGATGGGGAGSGGAPSSGGESPSSGGGAALGGSTATGGAPATGGSSLTGGALGAGGTSPTGGAPPTGGTSGSGGASSTGGAPPTGGTSGAAGAGDTGGTPGSAGAPAGGSAGAAGAGGSSPMGGGGGAAGVAGAGGLAGVAGAGSGAGGTPSACPEATPLTGGSPVCVNRRGDAGGGYGFELWSSGIGTGCMTVHGVDATFGATWSGVEDFLARVGLDFDSTRTHSQIGVLSADFAETQTSEGGLLYIGIYGWTLDPLREYYILDDWGSTRPAGTSSDGTARTYVGTLEADGDTYDVWTKTRENKPAIIGDNETFDQYFSIRQTARRCGHISISEHFTGWEGLGLDLGNLFEAKLLVEAQDNSGSVEFTTATVVVE